MSAQVGQQLKAVRIAFGLSQRELAKKAGVTNGMISLIEQNRVSPSVSSLKKVLDGVPMSLADACLVRLTERFPDCRLFTLDSDFEHYRRNGRQVIPLLHPD